MITRNFNNLVPLTSVATEGPLTVTNAAVTIASLIAGAAFAAQCNAVMVSVETDQIRLDPNGGAPTTTKGHLISPNQKFILSREEADVAKVIRVTTDAKIQVTQYRFA